MRVEFRVLGPVEIRDAAGCVVPLRSVKLRGMLAILLLHADRVVARDTVLRRLWPDGAPERNSIDTYVKNLRKAINGAGGGAARMPRRAGGWVLELDDQVKFDLHEVNDSLETARASAGDQRYDRVVEAARYALGQWRGMPLADVDGAWALGERNTLEEKRNQAWRLLLEAELALGRHVAVLDQIAEPLATWPNDQTLIHHHLLALYRADRGPEALAEYQAVCRRLVEAAGIDPIPSLQQLQARILRSDSSLLRPAPTAAVRARSGPVSTPVSALAAATALDGLPPREVFVGRDSELAQLAEALHPERSDAVVVVSAVAGQAGIGKTALAVRAAHQAREAGWFPGGVLFADLRGFTPDGHPLTAEQVLGSWLRDLGIADERIPADLAGREALYRSELAAHAQSGKRMLIVADNTAHSAQVRPLWPSSTAHRMLVTSRNTLADLGARLINLTILTEDEALALLEQHLRTANPTDDRILHEPDQAAELVRLCAGLPLALRLTAARLVDDPDQPLTETVERLADETTRLGALKYPGTLAVAASFELSYRTLTPEQARQFRLLSLNPGPQASTEAAAALADLPLARTRDLLDELRRAHLIEHGRPRGWWRLHDLMHLFARHRATHDDSEPDRDAALNRLLDHYATGTAAADQHLNRRVALRQRSAQFSGRQDALNWLNIEHPTLVAVIRLAARTGRHRHTRDLTHRLYHYFDLRKHWDDWIETHRLTLTATRHLGDRDGEGLTLNNLGVAYEELRRFDEAITCYQQALTIRREVGDRDGEGRTLNNLGIAYEELRRFDEAITCYQQDLAIRREVGDRHGEGLTLNNLGLAYWELRQSDALASLGRVYWELERIGDAHDCGVRALELLSEFSDAGALHAAEEIRSWLAELDDNS